MRILPAPIRNLLIVLTVLIALFPLFGEALVGDKFDFYLQKLTTIMILSIVALSLDLLVGITGMVSIAQAAFFGLAGYTLVLVAPEYEAVSIWVALPICLGVSALAALLMGLLIIRTSGIFFIMATIAFSQMLYFFFHDSSFTGGSDGAYLFMKPDVSIAGVQLLDLENRTTLFYVVLVSLIAVFALLRTFLRAPFGQLLLGIKENESRVRAMGYNPLYYKLVAFVIAGTLAGYAGMLSATQYGFVSPDQVGWELSAHVLVMVILGGMGTLFGAILGAFAFEGLHAGFAAITPHWELLMGLVVIGMVLVLPRGIAGLLLKLTERLSAKNVNNKSAAPLAGAVQKEAGQP
ncbi:branched-chain amino acid ABC transporter permease [Pseudomonas sp. NW5]|jgi:branched-chain amino acid transport system permease protein|uniref:branched-chain amino acid ABC transporter permease n=1 Tax=Pseudomonas sp. NW5 TaxID=2934934 RepID=UPI00202167A5|nr:branched-chain amino acid ABC transporter permease [Pseudomonas sp. NW5]MCL7461330.1 branched-chain amino acid ABC transporter permease [Pseudomonas sp. NW5]